MGLSQRWQEVKAGTRSFFRRHWQRALIIRNWLRLSEEAFHLILAALIGIAGGLINWIYYVCSYLLQLTVLQETGDVLDIANRMEEWQRLLIPAGFGRRFFSSSPSSSCLSA